MPMEVRSDSPRVRSVLAEWTASLPTLVTLDDDASTDSRHVWAADGHSSGWMDRAGKTSATAILVTGLDPTFADAGALADLTARIPTVILTPWAANPVLPLTEAPLTTAIADDVRAVLVLGEVELGTDLTVAMVDALAACAAASVAPSAIHTVTVTERTLVASGTVGRAPFNITLVASAVADSTLRITARDAESEFALTLPGSVTAAPAEYVKATAVGRTLMPTRYESSVRACLRRVATGEIDADAHAAYLTALNLVQEAR